MDFTQVFPINLNVFVFTQVWLKLFSLFKFNWSCWTLPNCSYFAKMFLILLKTLLKFFSWPKFDEGCWNYHMIPVHWRGVFILPSGAKKNGKIISDYFAVLAIILPLIGYYFASVWKIDTTSLTCECSCILCPNFENFCPNKGQFFSVGDATASPASPCRTLMFQTILVIFVSVYRLFNKDSASVLNFQPSFDLFRRGYVCDY